MRPPPSAAHALGAPLAKVSARAKRTGDQTTDAVAAAGVKAMRSLGSVEAGDQLFVGGSSRMAAAFDAVDTVPVGPQHPRAATGGGHPPPDILDTGLTVAIGTNTGSSPWLRAPSW